MQKQTLLVLPRNVNSLWVTAHWQVPGDTTVMFLRSKDEEGVERGAVCHSESSAEAAWDGWGKGPW